MEPLNAVVGCLPSCLVSLYLTLMLIQASLVFMLIAVFSAAVETKRKQRERGEDGEVGERWSSYMEE